MRKTIKLAVTLYKGGGASTTGKRSRAKWVLPAVLGVSFAIFAASMVAMTFEVYDVMAMGNAADAIIPLAFGATSIVIFVFGIFYVISTMYHASDIELLMALPLRPYQILGGKFLTLVVYEYILEAFVLIPILIGFGIKSGAGVPYVVYSVLLFLLTPVIALSIAAVIVMLVMRFTSFGKNKQAFKFIGGIIAAALAVGFNVLIQSGLGGITSEQAMAIATGESSLVPVVSSIFPGIIFAANTLILSNSLAGLGSFALFLLCSAAAVAVFLGVGQLVYFAGVAGVTETSAKRKALEESELSRKTQRGSKMASYIKKELRLLVRSPIAFLNCVLVNVMWPVILVAMLLFRGGSLAQFGQILDTMDGGIVVAILVALAAFVTSSNAVTSTAISREGKGLYFTKYIPMDMGRQLFAKAATGMIISSAGVVLLIAAAVVIGLDIWLALIALALGVLAMAVVSVIGLLIDTARPKLTWMNEQQAIKQNVNVVLHILGGLAAAALVVLPVIFAQMPMWLSAVYIAVVMGTALVLALRVLKTRAADKMMRMDV